MPDQRTVSDDEIQCRIALIRDSWFVLASTEAKDFTADTIGTIDEIIGEVSQLRTDTQGRLDLAPLDASLAFILIDMEELRYQIATSPRILMERLDKVADYIKGVFEASERQE